MLGEQYMQDFRPQIFDEKVCDIVVQRSDARPTSQTSQVCAASGCGGEARLRSRRINQAINEKRGTKSLFYPYF